MERLKGIHSADVQVTSKHITQHERVKMYRTLAPLLGYWDNF